MKNRGLIVVLALGAVLAADAGHARDIEMEAAKALVESMRQAGARMSPQAPPSGRTANEALNYATSCAVSGSTAYGFVTNRSADTYSVSGFVKFIFSVNPDDMTRRQIDTQALASIAPGQTVSVASAHIPFLLEKGEKCRFDVSGAIKK